MPKVELCVGQLDFLVDVFRDIERRAELAGEPHTIITKIREAFEDALSKYRRQKHG